MVENAIQVEVDPGIEARRSGVVERHRGGRRTTDDQGRQSHAVSSSTPAASSPIAPIDGTPLVSTSIKLPSHGPPIVCRGPPLPSQVA